MARTLATLAVEMTANSAKLLKEVQKATKSVESFSMKAQKAGKLVAGAFAGTVVAGSIKQLGSSIISVSADFESLQASLETVFGSQQKAARQFEDINAFASKTPFTIQEITEAAIRMKSLGLDPSIESLKSMGNTASALGKPLMQFTEAVADAVVGEFERLKEFGIKSSSQGDRVKFTFRGITTEVGKNADEIQKFLLDIGNTEFAGAIEKQADTLNGVFSTLQGSVDGFLVRLGEETGIAEAAKNAAKQMTAFFDSIAAKGPSSVEELNLAIAETEQQIIQLESMLARSEEMAGSSRKGRREQKNVERFQAEIEALEAELSAFQSKIVEIEEAKAQARAEAAAEAAKRQQEAAAAAAELKRAEEAQELEKSFERISESYLTEEELLRNKFINELAIIEQYYDARQGLEDQKNSVMMKARLKYFDDLNKIQSKANEKALKDEDNINKKRAVNAAVYGKNFKEFTRNLVLDIAKDLQQKAIIGAYAHGAEIGGPILGSIFAGIAGVATNAIIGQIGGGGGGAVPSPSAVPDVAATDDIVAANDEEETVKRVVVNVEGLDDEQFLSRDALRGIIDEINEAEGSNVVIQGL